MPNHSVVLLSILLSFAAGYQMKDWIGISRDYKVLQSQVEADRKMREELYNISMDTQEKIGNIKIENTTIYRKTEKEIIENPVYKECLITDEGLKLVNKARGHE